MAFKTFVVLAIAVLLGIIGYQFTKLEEVNSNKHLASIHYCQEINGYNEGATASAESFRVEQEGLEPSKTKEIRREVKGKIKVIEALAPKRDCIRYAYDRDHGLKYQLSEAEETAVQKQRHSNPGKTEEEAKQ